MGIPHTVNPSINLSQSVSGLYLLTFTHIHTHANTHTNALQAAGIPSRLLYILVVMSLMIILAQFTRVCGEGNLHIEISFRGMFNPSCHTPTLLHTDSFFRHVLSTCPVSHIIQGSWDTRMMPAFREFFIWCKTSALTRYVLYLRNV